MRKVTGYIGKAARFLLAAFIAVFCTFRGTFEIAEAKTAAEDTFIAGSGNDSEEFWTWKKVTSQTEMDNLFETYKKYDSSATRIPIMLICTIDGQRYMISCSQMVSITESTVSSDVDYSAFYSSIKATEDNGSNYWNYGYFGKGFTWHYLDRYTTISYKKVAYKCSEYEGLAATKYSDVVVTRGGYSPFYLESVNVSDPHTNRDITYKYQIYKDADPDSTDQELIAIAPAAYNQHGTVYFADAVKDTSSLRMNQNWNIEASDNQTFTIYTYYFPPVDENDWSDCLVQQRVGFCMTSNNKNLTWHQGMVAYQKKANQAYSAPYKNGDSTDGYSNRDNSYNIENFEIWYGVEGVTKDALDAVNGSETGKVSAEDQTIIQAEVVKEGQSKDIKSGNSYAVPDFTILYIPKGEQMTIEEGATVVVGRNAVIVNNGKIVNNGELIVQPGATILFDTTEEMGTSGDHSYTTMFERGYASIQGTGNLIIRDGGKVRLNGLNLSGDVYNSGLLCVEEAFKAPGLLMMNSGVLMLYINTRSANYWMYGTDILCGTRNITGTDSFISEMARKDIGVSAYMLTVAYANSAYADLKSVTVHEAVGSENDSSVIIGH